MSASKWRYTEACDGEYCIGDCDLCDKEPETEEGKKMTNAEFMIEYGRFIIVDRTEKTVEVYFNEYDLADIPLKARIKIAEEINKWKNTEVAE